MDLVAEVATRLGVLAPRLLGQVEPVIQQRRAAGSHAHQEDPDLAVVFLAEPAVVLPRHAGTLIALLGEAALVDDPHDTDGGSRGRGGQLLGEDGLDLGLDVGVIPGGDGDELLHRGDVAVADVQRDRLDALAFGADHQPFDVAEGVVLRLLLAEEGSESLVELDQSLGRGAHFVFGHGGSLQNVA